MSHIKEVLTKEGSKEFILKFGKRDFILRADSLETKINWIKVIYFLREYSMCKTFENDDSSFENESWRFEVILVFYFY